MGFNNHQPQFTAIDLLSIVRQSPVFLTLFDGRLRLLWCNRWAFGFSAEEQLGTIGGQQIQPEDRPAWLHAIRVAIDLGVVSSGSYALQVSGLTSLVRLDYRICQVHIGNEPFAMEACWDTTLKSGKPDPRHFLLTDKHKKIVRFLLEHGPNKGASIGRHLKETSPNGQATSTLRIILANLEERGILTNGQNGYSVAPGFHAYAVDIVGNCRQ